MRCLALFLAALVSIACDPAQCPQVSGPFGPCIPGYSACADGSTCMSAEAGDMCLPASPDGLPPTGYEACAAALGKRVVCGVGGTCRVECDSDAECGGGTVCSTGTCVWPYPPASGTTSTTAADESMSAGPTGEWSMTGTSTVATSTG